jgi:histidine ammonia-lyase
MEKAKRSLRLGKGTEAAYKVVRGMVSKISEDRLLSSDVKRLAGIIKSGELVKRVEEAVGALE